MTPLPGVVWCTWHFSRQQRWLEDREAPVARWQPASLDPGVITVPSPSTSSCTRWVSPSLEAALRHNLNARFAWHLLAVNLMQATLGDSINITCWTRQTLQRSNRQPFPNLVNIPVTLSKFRGDVANGAVAVRNAQYLLCYCPN